MRLKAQCSFLLILTLTTVYSLNALAAPAPVATTASETIIQDTTGPVGTLTGTGQMTVNDNAVQSGASVTNGSVVATGADGDASIDLGAWGRIQLRPNTTVRVLLAPNRCTLEMLRCGSLTEIVPEGVATEVKMSHSQLMQVAALTGEAHVNNPGGKDGTDNLIVKAGESHALDHIQSVTASGQAIFTVNCCDCDIAAAKGGGLFVGPGLAGLIALVGVGVAVVAGVVVGGEPRGRLSAVR